MPFDPVTMGMLGLGVVTHQVLTLAKKSKDDGHPPSLKDYYKQRPYDTAGTVLLSVIGYMTLGGLGELTNLTALGVGFTGDSVGNTMTELAKHNVKTDT